MNWPAMMLRKTAAAYLDMSENAFEREVASGRLPKGVMLGNKVRWPKDAIDQAIASLNGMEDWEAEFFNRGKAA